MEVAICICTFRRSAQLDRLLDALAAQRWTRLVPPRITAIVVENDVVGTAASVCDKHRARGKLTLHYEVEPRPGVPVARNRCLAAVPADADFVAFIDDDELPAPNWLEQLLLLQASTGADVVAGPVLASYTTEPSAWLLNGRFHNSRAPIPTPAAGSLIGGVVSALTPRFGNLRPDYAGCPVAWFDTGNVLVRVDILRKLQLRFDESLRHFGYGADSLFSMRIARGGYRMVWSSEAAVYHIVPPSRMTASWLLRRALQQGLCQMLVSRRLNEDLPRARIVLPGLAFMFLNVLLLPTSLLSGWHHVIWRLLAIARHLGRSIGALGFTISYDRRKPGQEIEGLPLPGPRPR